MKAILEFNLPEEENRLKLAIDAQKLQMIIHKTFNDIYDLEKEYKENDKVVEVCRILRDCMNEHFCDYDMRMQYSEIEWEDQ